LPRGNQPLRGQVLDGMAVDAEGKLCVAVYGGGALL
jgi:sugar lactone lactonase YvrE